MPGAERRENEWLRNGDRVSFGDDECAGTRDVLSVLCKRARTKGHSSAPLKTILRSVNCTSIFSKYIVPKVQKWGSSQPLRQLFLPSDLPAYRFELIGIFLKYLPTGPSSLSAASAVFPLGLTGSPSSVRRSYVPEHPGDDRTEDGHMRRRARQRIMLCCRTNSAPLTEDIYCTGYFGDTNGYSTTPDLKELPAD